MMTNERSTNIVFMIPREGVIVLGHSHISHVVKNDDISFKKCIFHNPAAGALVLGRGHMSYGEMHSLLLSMDQTNGVFSHDDQGMVYQLCKFHGLWGRGSCANV